jgi:catechol 2,3-dioxygenase-like lactoylglutathione lyase family enzyme
VTDFVHIGLVVEDLDETVRFLELLGLDCGEPGVFSGEWIDRIIGLEDVKVEVVMARVPDGSDVFEVVRFHTPSSGSGELAPATNRPGLRHVAFKVDDVRGTRLSVMGPVSGQGVPGGVVHELPADLAEALLANATALDAWNDITPLARNEFICWVEDAKQGTTRARRIRRTQEELEEGQRRPCCWPGCKHRERTGR